MKINLRGHEVLIDEENFELISTAIEDHEAYKKKAIELYGENAAY
jgi:hypothetical protein